MWHFVLSWYKRFFPWLWLTQSQGEGDLQCVGSMMPMLILPNYGNFHQFYEAFICYQL